MIVPRIAQHASISWDAGGQVDVDGWPVPDLARYPGFEVSCCFAGPRRHVRSVSSTTGRPPATATVAHWSHRRAVYRTVWRARVVLAAHLAHAHGVEVDAAALHCSVPVLCRSCDGCQIDVDGDDCPECDGSGIGYVSEEPGS